MALASAGAVAIAAGVVIGSINVSANTAAREQSERVGAAFAAAEATASPAPTAVMGATSTPEPVATPPSTPAAARAIGDPTVYDPAVYAANAGAGALSPAGPEEAGEIACMAELGYTWNWEVGAARATAELAAATAITAAGGALRDDTTREAERAAAASTLGIPVDQLDAYDAALVGVMNNDLSSCNTAAGLAVQDSTLDAFGGWGPDWWNQTAIDARCLADQGYTLSPEQRLAMRNALMAPPVMTTEAQEEAERQMAAIAGWDVATYRAYLRADMGDTGAGADYRWEEAGCWGFAVHAVGKDNAN